MIKYFVNINQKSTALRRFKLDPVLKIDAQFTELSGSVCERYTLYIHILLLHICKYWQYIYNGLFIHCKWWFNRKDKLRLKLLFGHCYFWTLDLDIHCKQFEIWEAMLYPLISVIPAGCLHTANQDVCTRLNKNLAVVCQLLFLNFSQKQTLCQCICLELQKSTSELVN